MGMTPLKRDGGSGRGGLQSDLKYLWFMNMERIEKDG
jgi:hypothetical protein